MPNKIKNGTKTLFYVVIPLVVRKRMAIWIDRQDWVDPDRRNWWSQELVRDLAIKDVTAYHKFQWANHLGYAESYEVAQRFGNENINQTRHMFFDDLLSLINESEAFEKDKISSVFDVGCSLGYHLRYMETDLFPSARTLEGIDIDEIAIRNGQKYLQSLGSKVRLHCGDMEALSGILRDRTFDLVCCCGTLMYLADDAARNLVSLMLKHTNTILAFTGLAHPDVDNSELGASQVRKRDRTWIHNIDSMVTTTGGKVIKRTWLGDKKIDGNTVYFVFCQKAQE